MNIASISVATTVIDVVVALPGRLAWAGTDAEQTEAPPSSKGLTPQAGCHVADPRAVTALEVRS